MKIINHFHITVASGGVETTAALTTLKELLMTVSAQTQALIDEVAQLKTTEESAVALLNGFADRLEASIDDRAALQQLATDLRSVDTALHDAVVANTPAAPETPPADPAA